MNDSTAPATSGEALRQRYELAIRDRRRALRLLQHLSRPSVVPSLLILASFAAHVLVVLYAGGDFWRRLLGSDHLHYALLRCGGKSNTLIAEGEVWRLLSAVFLHGSLLHLVVNCVGIHYLGKFAENLFGLRRVLLLYVFSGFGATVASFLFSDALSVGASGAVFGLLGGVGVMLLRMREQLPRRARRILLLAPLLWVVPNLILGWFIEDVDNAAHVGGLLAGCAMGVGFQSELFSATRRPSEGPVTAAAALAVVMLALTAGLAALSALRPLPPATARLAEAPGVPGHLPVPVDWHAGRLHERRCLPAADDGPAPPSGAPWCFTDAYESLLIVGDAGAVFPAQDELVAYLRAARVPEPPVEKHTGSDVLFVIAAGEGLTYVLACYPDLVERYRPLAARLYERAREHRGPAADRKAGAPRPYGRPIP